MAEFLAALGHLMGAGLSTTNAVEKVIKTLRNPPDELLTLANEISATNQTIDRARIIISQFSTQSTGNLSAIDSHPINFGQILGRANGIFVQLKGIFDSLGSELDHGSWKQAPRMVWIRRREQLFKLQNGLVECRKEMNDFIGSRNQ